MVAYGIAKARAMANRTDWNERTEITKCSPVKKTDKLK